MFNDKLGSIDVMFNILDKLVWSAAVAGIGFDTLPTEIKKKSLLGNDINKQNKNLHCHLGSIFSFRPLFGLEVKGDLKSDGNELK